jgi:hypothetical protein
VAAADIAAHDATPLGIVTVVGRDRTPADVAGELLSVLADEPRVVACDLTGMTAEGSAMPGKRPLVGEVVSSWPGTLLIVNGDDGAIRQVLGPVEDVDWLFLNPSSDTEAAEAHRLLPPVQRARQEITPSPSAPREARTFATGRLQDWGLDRLAEPASHVASAFVTAAVTLAPTPLDLTVSRVHTRIRIALREHDEDDAALQGMATSGRVLEGRGRELVQACADSWGVISAPSGTSTLWAVLDAAGTSEDPAATHGEQRSVSRHRGSPHADVLVELHGGRHRGTHRRDPGTAGPHSRGTS